MTADLHLILARSLGLLALVLFGYTALLRLRVGPLPRQLLAGLLFGGGAVVSMLDPAPIAPGVIADARSVMLGLAAPFGGPWSAPIAAAVVAAYRLWLGGAGAPAGALGAAISAAAGLLFWALMPKSRAALSLPSLVLLGGMASFNIFSAFLLPWETALKVVGTAGLPLTATTTGGILLFGTLLGRERERVARDALFRATFDSAPDALFVTEVGRDGGLAVGSLNPAALALLGHENQAKPGTPLAAVLPAELRDAALEDLRRCVAEGRTLQLQRSQVLHGRKAHWDLTLVPIRDELGRIGHVFSRRADITWRVEAEESLRRAAYADPLTGLANRRAFLESARRALAGARRDGDPLALLMIDVDHFKAINDRHGHETGDLVLVALAERLRTALREADLPARHGGEEFVALLPNTDLATALQVAERVRAALAAEPVAAPAGPIRFTVSIGVAALGPGLDSVERLLAEADSALYRAKAAGRDRVVGPDAAPAPASAEERRGRG